MIDYSKFKLYQSTHYIDELILVYDQQGWSCSYDNLSSVINILLTSVGWNVHNFPDSIGKHICNLDSLLKTNPEYFL